MNKKILIGILGAIAIAIIVLLVMRPSRAPLTQDQAIDAVIAQHPELEAYKTNSLPPSSIETKVQTDGWSIAFIQRGSGLPGILQAQCYHVSVSGNVVATGQYPQGDNSGADTIRIEDCSSESIPPPQQATTTATTTPTKPVAGKCYVGGCSSQLCTDQPDAVSNCMYLESYACYKTATCERQTNDQCGWTQTPELSACLMNP